MTRLGEDCSGGLCEKRPGAVPCQMQLLSVGSAMDPLKDTAGKGQWCLCKNIFEKRSNPLHWLNRSKK